MMDRRKLPEDTCREPLPDHPELALFVATLFQRLGGALEIDRTGRRHARRPDRDRLHRDGVPQLAEARPWEKFRSSAEWEGAMKLAEYWLARLSAPDKEYVFTLLAATPSVAFDFRDQL
jgi:hypothetical protein